MRGRIFDFDRSNLRARVDTGNDQYGVLTIYFTNRIPDQAEENSTVEFEVVRSRNENYYAKFQSVVERNSTIFNTEDRALWYQHGEDLETDFIQNCVPLINRNICINPEKAVDKTVIDLMDYTDSPEGYPCDLKTQNTPFFSSGKHCYRKNGAEIRYDPSYTVTFNKKDYERYRVLYPDCRIYFRVRWQQQTGYRASVENVDGVWVADFRVMCDKIESNSVYLHEYQNRRTNDHNAKDSYLFDLNDSTVFTRLL